MSILMWLFLTPLAASAIAFALARLRSKNIQRLALGMSLIPLAILLYGSANWIGMSVHYNWLPTLSIAFHLQVDALSLLFLYLTALIVPISIAVTDREENYANVFYAFILLLQALLMGFFTARDLALFTLFWESMLIPLYFIMVLWGGLQRQSAALKFLIYMIAGSALMIAAVLALYFTSSAAGQNGSFDIDLLSKISSSTPYAALIAAIFLLAFSVKTPLFPFHAWLPDAYCQAPIAGTILLSALLSKAGIYGFLRIGMELFPNYMKEWGPLFLGFALAGVLYGGLAAWRQNDFKRLIAYSSFSHVNFILAGIFVWSLTAQAGAILQAINHGITITGLFLVGYWLEVRLRSTSLHQASGLAKYMPQLCWLTLFFVLSSVALPGTNNFVGELLILFGLFSQNPWATSLLALTVILSVIYMLRWMQLVYFQTTSPYQPSWVDIHFREWLMALPLVLLILWIGIYPTPILRQIAKRVEATAISNGNSTLLVEPKQVALNSQTHTRLENLQ